VIPVSRPAIGHRWCECETCGKFGITEDAIEIAGDAAWKLSCHSFRQNLHGIEPYYYERRESIPPNAHRGAITVSEALEWFPQSTAERLDRALESLAEASNFLGEEVSIACNIICPRLFARNITELKTMLQHFQDEKYINQWNERINMFVIPSRIALTCKGLQRAGDLKRGINAESGYQAFVAMSFDNSMIDAYEKGIKSALEEAGFKPYRVDRDPHNDKICDIITSQIKRSRFMVADVTGHRNGVYFEAGLMKGLGRHVIFTCKRNEIKDAHFDTRQYNHILWDTPEDLKSGLTYRIEATIK